MLNYIKRPKSGRRAVRSCVLTSALMLAVAFVAQAAEPWQTDRLLGAPFESLTIQQPRDYSGPEKCTIVRLLTTNPVPAGQGRKGVLYVHGFNDYFFQAQMADSFVAHGYDFYAVDLRKYGRSLLSGQIRCDVRDMGQYFPDIDSALSVMRKDGVERIALMGHSTGGLTASYYLARNPQAPVEVLILNSPFLDWNMGKLEPFIPLVSALGAIMPGVKISSGSGDAYSSSLLASAHGEWTYDDSLKSHPSPRVTLGWVRAVTRAQHWLRNHPGSIRIPVLLMYSGASYSGSDWSPEAQHEDAVLDVNDILRYGRLLGNDVQPVRVVGGLHDLVLSSADVRRALYPFIFRWLEMNLHPNVNGDS